jgi:thiol-disulfide isomerase/thioredoxin
MGRFSRGLGWVHPAAAARLSALALIGLTVAALLSHGQGKKPARQQTGTIGSAAGVQLAVPDFQFTAAPFAGGGQFVLSQHADRPTILYGMAAWCGSCIGQARTLVRLKRELGDRFNLVVVDIDPNDTETNLRGFAKAAGGPLGFWGIDRGGTITRSYHILYLHTTIVIQDGHERSRSPEDASLDQLRAAVASAAPAE